MSTTTLRESGRAKGSGKRRRAKLISADVWGTTGYYPADVLARDAAYAFPVGTKMYENHRTATEEYERPVGDVSKMIGKLITAGEYEADNPEGPGVYADVEFYDSYVPRINEIGDDVGLSVDGGADYIDGEIAGRYGKIFTSLLYIRSVDVVTEAGAGGKLTTILESAAPMAGRPIESEGEQSVTAITKEDFLEGLAAFGDTLTTKIQEALAPVAAAPAEAVAAAAVETPAADAPAAEAAEPAATTTAVEVPVTSVEAAPEAKVEIDVAKLVTAVVDAGLPSEVLAQVVAAVEAGKPVEEAVADQTKIREAYAAQNAPSGFRIVEAGERAGQTTTTQASLSAGVLANLK